VKILKSIVIRPATGRIDKMDTIEFEGKLWLVPHWLDEPIRKVTKPARLIRMDLLPHQSMAGTGYGADFVVSYRIPKELFELTPLKEQLPGYEVLELPELEFPMADKTKN
jgi:hypothetical protein